MKIEFIVGTLEQHQMELSFDPKSGDLRIILDGTVVLHDSPRLARHSTKRYELSIGVSEKHKLALQLAYGDEPGLQSTLRISLKVSALTAQQVVPDRLLIKRADNVFAPNAAARA